MRRYRTVQRGRARGVLIEELDLRLVVLFVFHLLDLYNSSSNNLGPLLLYSLSIPSPSIDQSRSSYREERRVLRPRRSFITNRTYSSIYRVFTRYFDKL